MKRLVRIALFVGYALVVIGCGGEIGPEPGLRFATGGGPGSGGAPGDPASGGSGGQGMPTCGDGILDAGESCDPSGSCPASCDDGNACTSDTRLGSPETCDVSCDVTLIDLCVNGDGCCPASCTAVDDNDCSASCGNGTLEAGETCDPEATCPVSCDDQNACTNDVLTGSAANCNVACSYTDVVLCTSNDGCCPAGCNARSDNDCAPMCGNGVVEPGETCDPSGSCPASCSDGNACTADALIGDADSCTAQCQYSPVTSCVSDDGCCPQGCTEVNDNDCTDPSMCGGAGPGTTPLDTEEQNFLQLLNQHRGANGRAPVAACTSLNRAAQGHSEDMRDQDYFDHDGLNGSSPIERACDACYESCAVTGWGENIAAGNSGAQGTFNQWVNSPGHNANMLGENFVVIGIGRATGGGTFGTYWTTVFGGQSDSSCQ